MTKIITRIMRGLTVLNIFFAGLFLYRYITTLDNLFFFMWGFNAFVAGWVWESDYES